VHLQRADIYHSHLKYSLLFGAGLGRPHVHTHHNVLRPPFSPVGFTFYQPYSDISRTGVVADAIAQNNRPGSAIPKAHQNSLGGYLYCGSSDAAL
jgi:hypothetical protein